MNALKSTLNYGALIALSCCNAVLQIAAVPVCSESVSDLGWPSCAADGAVLTDELSGRLLKPPQGAPVVLADDAGARAPARNDRLVAARHQDGRFDAARAGSGNVGREWRLDADRLCLKYDPGFRRQPECGAIEVAGGRLYLVEGQGRREAVNSIGWALH